MSGDGTVTGAEPAKTLRMAAAEALLAGGFVLADVQREGWNQEDTKDSEVRFRRALESLAVALGSLAT